MGDRMAARMPRLECGASAAAARHDAEFEVKIWVVKLVVVYSYMFLVL
jgi:hypothetical protein